MKIEDIEKILKQNLPNFEIVKYEICRRCWFSEKCIEYCGIIDYVKELFDEYVKNVIKDLKKKYKLD